MSLLYKVYKILHKITKKIIKRNRKLKIITEFNLNNLKFLNISPLEFFVPLVEEGINEWYILLPTSTISINMPDELTTLLSIAENRNLNLLGMIKRQ